LFVLDLTAQKHLPGDYKTPWGAELLLKEDSTFTYSSFECYHVVSAKGDWACANDTLYLTTTSKPAYDSVVSIESSRSSGLSGIRIFVVDRDSTPAYFNYVTAYSGGEQLNASTDTLGYVDIPLLAYDSLRVMTSPFIRLDQSSGNNLFRLTLEDIDLFDREDFNERPFLVKGRKLLFVFNGVASATKYFKKRK